MKKNTILICILTLLLMGSACQPTPDEPIVVNKGARELENMIHATPEPTAVNTEATSDINNAVPEATMVPVKYIVEHKTDTFQSKDKKVVINVDADVKRPSVDKMPVVEIAPMSFDMEKIKELAGVFLEGKPMYEPRGRVMTKGQLENEILKLKKSLANPEQSNSDGLKSGDPEIVKSVTEMFENRIKAYQKLHEDAPDQYTPKEVVFEFNPVTYYEDPDDTQRMESYRVDDLSESDKRFFDERDNTKQIIMEAELNEGYGNLDITNYEGTIAAGSRLEFKTREGLMPYYSIDMPECKLTKEEFLAKAEELLSQLGLEDMKLTGLDVNETRKSRDAVKLFLNGYSATYQRAYYGVITDNDLEAERSEIVCYGPWYDYETIRIEMDSNLISVYWNAPTKEVGVVNDNVAIKSWDEIYPAFKKQMALQYNMEDPAKKRTINISSIDLCLARVAIPNNPNRYRMIPVWRFYGGEGDVSSKGYYESSMKYCKLFLTINAIDGSVINQEGY